MVFEDGNDFIYNFTTSVDMIVHEISHALIGHMCPLESWDQSGALNEHLSDVLGVMMRQVDKNQAVQHANRLIGEDCLSPTIRCIGLRILKASRTAYDDLRIVRPPLPLLLISSQPTTYSSCSGC